ncbi:MAG: hypothetical protein WCO23_02645 [bacterium]
MSEIFEEIAYTLKSIGLIIFFQEEYKGGELPNLSSYSVGVVAAYFPRKSAIFSIVFRVHPEGENKDQYFQYHIISQHTARSEIESLSPRCKLFVQSIEAVPKENVDSVAIHSRHRGNVHQIAELLHNDQEDVANKIRYAGTLFGQFLGRYRNTLRRRFSGGIIPFVVPEESNICQLALRQTNLRAAQLPLFFWLVALADESRKELLYDPNFPVSVKNIPS